MYTSVYVFIITLQNLKQHTHIHVCTCTMYMYAYEINNEITFKIHVQVYLISWSLIISISSRSGTGYRIYNT